VNVHGDANLDGM